jgi:putative membrane protein
MKIRHLSQALAAALLVTAACAASAQSDSTSDTKTGLSAADTVFIENAAKGGIAEIQMGKTALGKSGNDKVKALAQRIVDDHTKADEALKTLAESKKVSFPSDPAQDAQKENDKLQAMKPAGFDQAWAKAMIKDHQDAIKLFTAEGKDTKDTDIQQFVKTNLPTLKSHLEAAQKLAAVPDARDQAMDQASKSMISAMDSTPATASTATTAATAPLTAQTPTAKTSTPAAAPSAPAASSGAKH